MAKQVLNVGTAPNDGTGDTLRDASVKINANFTELYAGAAPQLVNGAYTVTLGSTGNLTFPDGYLKVVPNGANPYISNRTDNGLGLVSGNFIQIRQSTADAYGISINSSTTDTSLGGGAELSGGSNIDVNGTKIILGQYTTNYLNANTGLTVQNKIEINNNAILIGIKVSTITDGVTTSAFNGWTFSTTGSGNLTLPQGGVIDEGNSPTGVGHSIILKPQGGSATQALLIYPTAAGDGDHVHLTAGGGSTELYLGNDLQYVKLVNGGNIEVRASTANYSATAAWTFGTNGALTFPDDTVQTTAYTGASTTRSVGSVAGAGTVTLNYSTDRLVRATAAGSTITIAHSNITSGKVVDLVISNTSGASCAVTYGVAAGNTIGGTTTFAIGNNTTHVFTSRSFGTTTTDVYVTVV